MLDYSSSSWTHQWSWCPGSSSADKIKSIAIGTLLPVVLPGLGGVIVERLCWMLRKFPKVFPYHLSSLSRWWMLGAETSLNWDGFFCVVSYASSSCEGGCCKGNESLICFKQWRKVLHISIDTKHEAGMLVVPFSITFSVFVFVSERSGICVWIHCLQGGRNCVVFHSFWLAIWTCWQWSTAGTASWEHFQMPFSWGTCLSY